MPSGRWRLPPRCDILHARGWQTVTNGDASLQITDTTAVVTGGASGLGEAAARCLAARGARVAVLDLDETRGARVADAVGGVFARVDVADIDSIRAGLATVRKELGQERILVTCAGIFEPERTIVRGRESGAIRPHDAAAFARHVAINLTGTFLTLADSAAGMATLEPRDGSRGVVVLTASVAAQEGQIGQVAYAASKAGVAGMVLPIARDLAKDGIRAVAILPGLFETPMFDGLREEAKTALAAGVPFPSRLGRPEEYAQLVQHIVENDMLNGCCIRLDGALRMAPK